MYLPVVFCLMLVVCPNLLASNKTELKPLKKVKISFLEALAPKDTTSSERFQKDYVSAIEIGKRITRQRLSSCGYELDTKTFFYDASDPLQAKEQAEKAVKDGAWLMIGPRRSNHYLLLVKGAQSTPTVSLMASASEVDSLGGLHLSLSPTNPAMAKSAAKEIAKRLKSKKTKTYISVVSEDCISCKDFAVAFEKHASVLKLKKLNEIKIIGDDPETTDIVSVIQEQKPDFVLLPNYSRSSSHIMSAVQKSKYHPIFVGSDGWGDSKFGFIQNNDNIDQIQGFTVRGTPPVENGIDKLTFKKELASTELPASGPGLGILKAIDSTTEFLCQSKPKDGTAFATSFFKKGRKLFSAPWGVSVFNLKDGNLSFERSLQ